MYDLAYRADGMLLASTRPLFPWTPYGDILSPSPLDTTWHSIRGNILPDLYRSLCVGTGGTIFVGSDSAGVFRSGASDTHWTPVNSGLANMTVNDIVATPQGVLYATTPGGVHIVSLDQ